MTTIRATGSLWCGLASLTLVSVTSGARAQGRREAPSGREIAAKARSVKLDPARGGVHEFKGHQIRFTPADMAAGGTLTQLEQGVVVGTFESDVTGEKDAVAPGKYDLFLSKVNGEWVVSVESTGQVARTLKVEGKLKDVLDRLGAQASSDGLQLENDLERNGPMAIAPVDAIAWATDQPLGDRRFPWSFVPYTVCYYACVAASGRWYNCGPDCEGRYSLT